MKGKKEELLIIVLSALSMVFLIHIGSTIGKKFQLDFTQENLYTLSDGSVSILKKLNAPIKLKFFYSKTAANKGSEGIRGFNNYAQYVEKLLKQYVANSGGNLTLEIIDPRPDTENEENAVAYGLKKFYITQTESYIFGLVAISETGTEKTIEFFDPNKQETVEYDITKMIYTVTDPKKKTIGILSSLPIIKEETSPYMAQMMRMQGKKPEESWIFIKFLREFYNLKEIKPDTAEIKSIDTLLVVHPKNFSEKTRFAIDQFVIGGGNLLLLVDPSATVDRIARQGDSNSSNLKKLMSMWGLELVEGQFAGDKYLSGIGATRPGVPPSRLLPLVTCDQRCTDGLGDSISSGLKQLTLIYPGVLKFIPLAGVKGSPVLTTTDKGNAYSAGPRELMNPAGLWNKFSEGSSKVPMGYKVIGKYKTAFPGGISVEEVVAAKSDKEKPTKHRKILPATAESLVESAVVVIADVDFIHDQFAFKKTMFGVQIANNNSNLVLNALEALSGSKDLIAVRSKGKFNRNFTVIDKIEFESEQKTSSKTGEINGSIRKFQNEINQLGRMAKGGNIALIQSESVRKKRELTKKVASLKRELRSVKRDGREKVENIGKRLQYINTLLVPVMVLLFGFFYNKRRKKLTAAH
ncbi:MAG: GldG family protein [Bacteriovoracaceae bacterium]|jgi:ABC-2 type transport system permease protein|nr:GldG family protein [Bacteriovoracaceae bacterium]